MLVGATFLSKDIHGGYFSRGECPIKGNGHSLYLSVFRGRPRKKSIRQTIPNILMLMLMPPPPRPLFQDAPSKIAVLHVHSAIVAFWKMCGNLINMHHNIYLTWWLWNWMENVRKLWSLKSTFSWNRLIHPYVDDVLIPFCRYGDMRVLMAYELFSMWQKLGLTHTVYHSHHKCTSRCSSNSQQKI